MHIGHRPRHPIGDTRRERGERLEVGEEAFARDIPRETSIPRRDPAYQARTTELVRSFDAVGGIGLIAIQVGILDISDSGDGAVYRRANLIVLQILITQMSEEQWRVGRQITQLVVDPIGIIPLVHIVRIIELHPSQSRDGMLAISKRVVVVRLSLQVKAFVSILLRGTYAPIRHDDLRKCRRIIQGLIEVRVT